MMLKSDLCKIIEGAFRKHSQAEVAKKLSSFCSLLYYCRRHCIQVTVLFMFLHFLCSYILKRVCVYYHDKEKVLRDLMIF